MQKEVGKVLRGYLGERRGPTFVAVLSPLSNEALCLQVPALRDFPLVKLHISDGFRSIPSLFFWVWQNVRWTLARACSPNTRSTGSAWAASVCCSTT